MAYNPAEAKFITKTEGPLGVARGCNLCRFVDFRRKYQGDGRGAGFREGNRQRGRMIQHVKEAHPVEYAAAMEAAREAKRSKPK